MADKQVTLQPLAVTVVGTGDGAPLKTGTTATTKGREHPNLVVTVISPLTALAIRFVNLFLTTLVGLLMAAVTPTGAEVLGAGDFGHLLMTCASLSVAPAALGFLKDCVTLFGQLENKWPLLTGQV